MRLKFQATDATGKMHKRSSMSRVYTHCVLIHFAPDPPNETWANGVPACSHAEWAGSRALAESIAAHWRAKESIAAIEILEVRQV
jgi:hypothetical protein